MKGKMLIIVFLLMICTKGEITYSKSKYVTYEEFKKKYIYFHDRKDYGNKMLVRGGFSLVKSKNENILEYILKKENNLEYMSKFEDSYLDNFIYKDRVIQVGRLILEVNNQNEIITDINILLLFNSILKEYNENLGKKEFYNVLEKNFTEDELQVIIGSLTYNSEFLFYQVEKGLGLKKVDKVNKKLGEKKPITEKEWYAIESKPYEKLFKKEVAEIMGKIYLLSNNKIIIINDKDEILKEIKVKDYKETEYLVYKDILYIYSDKKIYEVPLNNLNNIKVNKV